MAAGEIVRPALYTIVEDIGAVDGELGRGFREGFDRRYRTEAALRTLLVRLSWLWGLSGLGVAAAITALAFTLNDVDKSFIVGEW